MAERAHPDDPNFKAKWTFRLRKGFFPWWSKRESPYKSAFLWRYNWVSGYCVGKDVVDIPCGMGWGTSLICGARSLIGFDLCPDAIAEATRRYSGHAAFHVGDMAEIDLPNFSADVVCCLEGIEHVPVEVGERFLMEARRILRPDGKLLISSPFCKKSAHSGNPFHIHEYQPEEIRSLLSKHFTIENSVSREVDIMTVLYLSCVKR